MEVEVEEENLNMYLPKASKANKKSNIQIVSFPKEVNGNEHR